MVMLHVERPVGSARSGAGHPNLKDSPERGLTPCPWSCYNMITGQDPNEEDSKMSELASKTALCWPAGCCRTNPFPPYARGQTKAPY